MEGVANSEDSAPTDPRGRLGLYIVQKIAEAHGGTVHVESTDLLGTTFTVMFPPASPPPASPG